AQGLFELANASEVQLIGGDLTQGSLTISIQILGLVSPAKVLRRDKAQVGDLIYVTGDLAAAGFALQYLPQKKQLGDQEVTYLRQRLLRPSPQVAAGQALGGIAHAAIDISDGLAADLNHILSASQVGATIQLDALPVCDIVKDHLSTDPAYELALTAGDDYELCFTAAKAQQQAVEEALTQIGCRFSLIGKVESESGLRFIRQDGSAFHLMKKGYEHFSKA
ncbi:MAG: thiamine-phosphate kinase, partial [Gammaproteobacteria bacterium]